LLSFRLVFPCGARPAPAFSLSWDIRGVSFHLRPDGHRTGRSGPVPGGGPDFAVFEAEKFRRYLAAPGRTFVGNSVRAELDRGSGRVISLRANATMYVSGAVCTPRSGSRVGQDGREFDRSGVRIGIT